MTQSVAQTPICIRLDQPPRHGQSSPRHDQDHPGDGSSKPRLLMFGFAGGTITSLLTLARAFGDDVEVWGVEYPGHGMQWQRPLHHQLAPMLDDLLTAIDALSGPPLILLGYSMGAYLCHRLAQQRAEAIDGLVLLSARPPQDPDLSWSRHDISDKQLLERLRSLGGLPEDILAHQGLMALFMPVMRADLAICAELAHSGIRAAAHRISCPLLTLQGSRDQLLHGTSMHPWQSVSTRAPKHSASRVYDGGHFFHWGQEQLLAADIRAWMTQNTPCQPLPARPSHLPDTPFFCP